MQSLQLSDQQIQILRSHAKRSLYFLAKGILGYDKFVPRIHGALASKLQDRSTFNRGAVVPRSFFKTTLSTISYPIWSVLQDPNIRILLTCNTYSNACKMLGSIKQQWERNQLLRAIFPELCPNQSSRWSSEALEFPRTKSHPEATIEAAGTATTITSRHYDEIIEDDLVAPTKDELDQNIAIPDREKCSQAIGWHQSTHGLAVTPGSLRITSVATRWATYDIINWQMQHELFDWFTLRCVNEDSFGPHCTPTFPERYTIETLLDIRKKIGSYLFSTQYMNLPTDEENMVFSPLWLSNWTPRQLSSIRERRTVIIVDPASAKVRAGLDYNAIVVVTAGEDLRFYVREIVTLQGNPGNVVNAIIRTFLKFQDENPIVYCEDIAYQDTLEYWLKRTAKDQGIQIPTRLYHPKNIKDWKVSHIKAMQPYFEAGRVLLPPNSQKIEQMLKDFPLSETDDEIDALAWAIKVLREPSPATLVVRDFDTFDEVDRFIEESEQTIVAHSLYSVANAFSGN